MYSVYFLKSTEQSETSLRNSAVRYSIFCGWLFNIALLKKLFYYGPAPFHMAPRPIDAFTLAARAEFFVGFPDIVGNPAVDRLFVDFNNRKIAVPAH